MTMEMQIRRIFDRYEDAMEILNKTYDSKIDRISVNPAGEVSASELLDINAWQVQEENRIKKEMIEAVINMEKERGLR